MDALDGPLHQAAGAGDAPPLGLAAVPPGAQAPDAARADTVLALQCPPPAVRGRDPRPPRSSRLQAGHFSFSRRVPGGGFGWAPCVSCVTRLFQQFNVLNSQ